MKWGERYTNVKFSFIDRHTEEKASVWEKELIKFLAALAFSLFTSDNCEE